MWLEKKLNHTTLALWAALIYIDHWSFLSSLSPIWPKYHALLSQINPSQTQVGDVGRASSTLSQFRVDKVQRKAVGMSPRLTSLHSTCTLSNFNTHISKQETTEHAQPHLCFEPAKTDELHSSAQDKLFCIPLVQCPHNRKHLLHVLLSAKLLCYFFLFPHYKSGSTLWISTTKGPD